MPPIPLVAGPAPAVRPAAPCGAPDFRLRFPPPVLLRRGGGPAVSGNSDCSSSIPFSSVAELFRKHERRDPQEIVGSELPEPIPFESQREFVRATLANEVDLRANGTEIVPLEDEAQSSIDYREYMNSQGSPSETVAAGYRWRPGTELMLKKAANA